MGIEHCIIQLFILCVLLVFSIFANINNILFNCKHINVEIINKKKKKLENSFKQQCVVLEHVACSCR